jgi:hypothetical protein
MARFASRATSQGEAGPLPLATSPNGTALAVWIFGYHAVRASHFDGTKWEDPVDVSPLATLDLALPSVGMNKDGEALVVWRDYTPADVLGASHFDGKTFDAPVDLCPPEAMECYLPGAALGPDGDGFALFELDYNLNAVPYTKAGGWQPPVPISTTTRAAYGAHPKLGYADSGDLLTIWREENADYDFRCFGMRYDAQSGWGKPELLQPDPGDLNDKALAVAPDGRAIAFFTNSAGTEFWAAYYTPAGGWAPAFVVDAATGTNHRGEVAAAINAEGQAVLAWTSGTSPVHVRTMRYDPP